MTDKVNSEGDGIPILTVGQIRIAGLLVPEAFADSPDDTLLAFPRATALEIAGRALQEWQVPDQEAAEFCAVISDEILRDVLIAEQMLSLLIPNQAHRFMHSPRETDGGQSPWELFKQGKSAVIRRELEHQVFAGSW